MVAINCYEQGKHLLFLLENEQGTNHLTGKRQLKQSTETFKLFANKAY